MLDQDGTPARLCRLVLLRTGSRLDRCLFVQTEHHLVEPKRASVQLADQSGPSIKFLVTWGLGAEPVMGPPRLELVRHQDLLYPLGRDLVDYSIPLEGSCQFCARPQREGAPLLVGQLASQFDQVSYNGGGKSGLGARFWDHRPGLGAAFL